MSQEPKATGFFVGDNVINIILGLFSVFIFVESNSYSAESRLFPQLISGLTFFLCLFLFITKFRAHLKAKNQISGNTTTPDQTEDKPKENYNWLIMLAFGFGYFLLFKPLGFVITTFLTMFSVPVLLGFRRYIIIGILAVALTLGFYWLFTSVFYVPLPKGFLGI